MGVQHGLARLGTTASVPQPYAGISGAGGQHMAPAGVERHTGHSALMTLKRSVEPEDAACAAVVSCISAACPWQHLRRGQAAAGWVNVVRHICIGYDLNLHRRHWVYGSGW